MDSQLTFGDSFSISQFKNHFGCTAIDVVKNPKNGKLFWVGDNGMQGPVSSNADLQSDDLQMTNCTTPEGEEMWMICKKQVDNVVVTL